MEKLPVIFRRFPKNRGGEVIAIFPTVLGTYDPSTFTTYVHVGQHGSGDQSTVNMTKLARPTEDHEAAALLKELRGIYAPEYELVVIERVTKHHRAIREAELKRINAAA